MKQKIKYNGQDIYFKTYGQNHGNTIFFLHGYLESSDIWSEFAPEFSDEYYVVCIDLPGHGDSEAFSETQTMGSMAYAVKEVADSLGINKFHLVGHSMGGYVTMAFRDKFPERLNSFILFHSTCFSDTEEKRANRDREIELVRQGRKDMIINSHVPKTFAESNLKKMSVNVERVKNIALRTKENGIVSALKGMKMRPDRCLLLVAGGIPFMLIAGKKDNFIPLESVRKMKSMAKTSTCLILEKSGHMGFIEEKDKSVKELKAFIESFSEYE